MDPSQIALALGSSLAAGLNLYLTVLTLGLLERFEVLHLPPELAIVSNTWVLATAGFLFLVEFVADKVPYVDNVWDTIHGFIRVPAGALLAVGAMSGLSTEWLWVVALLGGFVSFSAHGAKSSVRLAANASPEPFSNIALSLTEDAISLGLLWLVSSHPTAAIIAGLILLAACVTVIFLLYRFFRLVFRRRRSPAPEH